MKLQSKLPHMVGKSVKVNGNTYHIDAEGILDVGITEDLEKLIANESGWKQIENKSLRRPDMRKHPSVIDDTEEVSKPKPAEPKLESKPVEPEDDQNSEELPEDEVDKIPDPNVDMSMEELKSLAELYQVKCGPRMKDKEVLVQRILHAMYGEEEK